MDVWGILAAVDYDPDTLELLGYTFGDIFTESQFTVQNDRTAAPYKLLATLDEIGTISADGNFVTLKFKVKEDAAEKETTISLQILEAVGETSAVAVGTGGDIRMAVDDSVPAIGGIRDGGTYCPDQLFTVSDANMETVTVNGEVQTAVDGEYALAAGANGNAPLLLRIRRATPRPIRSRSAIPGPLPPMRGAGTEKPARRPASVRTIPLTWK